MGLCALISIPSPSPIPLSSSTLIQVDRSFSLIDELSEPLDEALCSQAVEAAIRTQRPQLASRFMEARLGSEGGVWWCAGWGRPRAAGMLV